ncbi:DUF4247 domain-containing protein [Virgibacillus profundi]|uniref:DUF4247 domain-containing protein n=1 Tax=Virgibacillus profundi TaxID=2024555 RepID=A0A2A2IAX2_9BACI|nr:DUF4247 domain-containing protein [Virgibacillus profundi]PAV28722.1 DUF4247 domain-containing protein [Virgibacillus profundi]PXY52890.1 DUF4247 domain-containing protein [Virgibacillus profundi]
MLKKWSLLIGLLFLILLLTACSFMGQQDGSITAEDIPDEPSKDEISSAIERASNDEIDDIIEANFPLMEEITGESQKAEIYATKEFKLTELASVLSTTVKPEEISEVKDNQQILIYPDEFITLRESDEDQDVLMIEVAGDEFVKRNYSSSFLSTYFTIRLLENMLGVNNWGNRSRGEYRGMRDIPNRGNTTFRGGGPGAGK